MNSNIPQATVFGEENSPEQVSSAFWQLWLQYRDELYRYCVKWMGNPTQAEDALSQAMLKAWQKVQTGADDIQDFKAWIKQLTKNLCMDLHRQRLKREVKVLEIEAIASEDDWTDEDQNPLQAVTENELNQFFADAIDQLPPKLREAFILYVEQKQSYQAIAEQLDISYANARKRISDARKILRQQWQQYQGEEATPPPASSKQLKTKSDNSPTSVESETTPPTEESDFTPPAPESVEQHQPTLEEETLQEEDTTANPAPITTENPLNPDISTNSLESANTKPAIFRGESISSSDSSLAEKGVIPKIFPISPGFVMLGKWVIPKISPLLNPGFIKFQHLINKFLQTIPQRVAPSWPLCIDTGGSRSLSLKK
ncbi:sigma-70 family RNA polymerase sigma factor [Laspinema sp. D1]|uniref:Sigma-70 family RNA polymerase sigma factor n=1 Tax=Laspinema palackyanum D2a TaxID=2953684 RepID=A0ABT2MRV6_9CYAN|nr:sigma-70 family RNA polymerase sigma factor [Laspinema sp. D2a]